MNDHGCAGGSVDTVQNHLIDFGTTSDGCVTYVSGSTGNDGVCQLFCDGGSIMIMVYATFTERISTDVTSIMNALT